MGWLTRAWKNRQDKHIALTELADIVAPLMLARHWKKGDSFTPKDIAAGWSELRDYVRIGFDHEQNKGRAYELLFRAFRIIDGTIKMADPESSTLCLRKIDLQMLQDSFFQIESAADYLVTSQAYKKSSPTLTYRPVGMSLAPNDVKLQEVDVLMSDGQTLRCSLVADYTDVPPNYNRPQADYVLMADELRTVHKNMTAFFQAHKDIKPASAFKQDEYLKLNYD